MKQFGTGTTGITIKKLNNASSHRTYTTPCSQLYWDFSLQQEGYERKPGRAVKAPDHPYRLGELFCGAGGFGAGAVRARGSSGNANFCIEPVWATDINPDACATYTKNIFRDYPGREAICSDVRDLDFTSLPEVDALAFGFPCNDYSLAGERKGLEGHYGPLYQYCVKALKHFRPLWFVAENVGGIRTVNEGRTLEAIQREFAEAGYDITSHYYHLEEYGLPQYRHRIIIVGIRNDLKVQFEVPEVRQGPMKTARMALEKPMPENVANNEISKISDKVAARLQAIEPGKNAFNSEMKPELQLQVKSATLSMIYRRLHPDKPSYTVIASGGGGTYMYHWKETRALTNRERARLQSFSDSFEFVGSRLSVRRQIGMAIPCLAAQIICEAVLKAFEDASLERDEVVTDG